MSRWTGQEDFGDYIEKNGYNSISNLAFYEGIPFETAPIMHDRVEDLVSYFANPVLFRVDIGENGDDGGCICVDDESWFDIRRRLLEQEGYPTDSVDVAEAAFNNFVEEVKRNGYHK